MNDRRILVIANETVEGDNLHELIRSSAADTRTVEVLVVAPALNSRLRHWMSDEDAARRAAEERLVGCLQRLELAGVRPYGWVGDADPLLAMEDALRAFPADAAIIATHPEERSNWLAHHLVERARERFALPIAHVVVEPAYAAA